MTQDTIDQLIINSPYEEPRQHWRYDSNTLSFERVQERRRASYVVTASDPSDIVSGELIEIPLVNLIRERVGEWRQRGYPGISGVTRRLLDHWQDDKDSSGRRFFFAQIEAIETLIWLLEGPSSDRIGISISTDGGPFERWCAKMATGTGKTVVMAMLIAWQTLNKNAHPQDIRFSKNFLLVAPGLTVKKRLAVLDPKSPENYYDEFSIVPVLLRGQIQSARVVIHNWHKLAWETAPTRSRRKSVVRLPPISDTAYAREVLGGNSGFSNWIVINDEAHHAWRRKEGEKYKSRTDSGERVDTRWIEGLDRIHRTNEIRHCYDFSATPFDQSAKSIRESLFTWIVSDFGLNDAIESGLVKSPRVVIKDDGIPSTAGFRSKFYHLFGEDEVKDDLNRRVPADTPLPDLVKVAYDLLGSDWQETNESWREAGHNVPPVMITVANRTETAARIKYAFDHGQISIPELCEPENILHIDSNVLEKSETQELGGTQPAKKAEREAESLREQVNTIGQIDKPGEQVCNIISVAMLNEGWDAKTVTQILGLRAFTSQLLCEQVVGRGLRRTSYDVNPETGLFDPEYVNVFGIPFAFLPYESPVGPHPPPPPPKVAVFPDFDKEEFEILWPNVQRIERTLSPKLQLDYSTLEQLVLDASGTPSIVELAPTIDGHPDPSRVNEIASIDLARLAEQTRFQTLAMQAASTLYQSMSLKWRYSAADLVRQLFCILIEFVNSDSVQIVPQAYSDDTLRRKLVIKYNLTKVCNHIANAIKSRNSKSIELVFNPAKPIGSTSDMPSWFTGKKWLQADKCHINRCVYDSGFEAKVATKLMASAKVKAWVKNDHLGFEVGYMYRGIPRRYIPDFLVHLSTDDMLVIEVKGMMTDQDREKIKSLKGWCRDVTQDGRFGNWHCVVVEQMHELEDALESLVPS